MFVRVCWSFCTVVAGGETDTPQLFPPIMYTFNLCSASLRKTMRRDASFGYDTRADTWKEIGLIWFGNDRVTRARVRREAEREWVWGKKEIDQRGGGNSSRLCIFHLWSRHLCSFSHWCLMLSQTSPSKQLQCVCLALCFCSTLSLILFPPFLYRPQKQNRQISHLSLV